MKTTNTYKGKINSTVYHSMVKNYFLVLSNQNHDLIIKNTCFNLVYPHFDINIC
jgi:hypothetical protein